jgi:hypothetical protein
MEGSARTHRALFYPDTIRETTDIVNAIRKILSDGGVTFRLFLTIELIGRVDR